MKTYEEMEVDAHRAELRNLRWKFASTLVGLALDVVIIVSVLYLTIEWYGNLGPCRP